MPRGALPRTPAEHVSMLTLGDYPREYVATRHTGARDTGWRTARAAHGRRASVLAYLSFEPRNPEWDTKSFDICILYFVFEDFI